MRQFIEALIAFQVITGRYSPVMKVKSKGVRTAILASIIFVLTTFQIYMYTSNKEDNLYELLELESPYVSHHQIDVAFDKAKTKWSPLEEPANQGRFDKIKAAQKCLKRTRCRDQYTRYNLSIDLPDDPNIEIDWRLGFTILFYIMFAFTQTILSTKEQKPGIRFGMGLGIMFCIDEIMILNDVQSFIKEGQSSDASVQRVLGLFPQSYCTFEIAMLSRLVFFGLFNIINVVSLNYVINDDKERVIKSEEMRRNQIQLTRLAERIYKEHTGKEVPIKSELDKKEYVECKTKMLKELQVTIASIQLGKTKEELTSGKPTKMQKVYKLGGLIIPVLLFGRWMYTKYEKSQNGEEFDADL